MAFSTQLQPQGDSWKLDKKTPIGGSLQIQLPPVDAWSVLAPPGWRLRGTTAEGLLCHKPCTVSGGGKSEISKSIADAQFTGPVFINDFAADSGLVDSILFREYPCGMLRQVAREERLQPLLPQMVMFHLLPGQFHLREVHPVHLLTLPR